MNTALSAKKIVEWKSAFYSMEDSQNKDARILASLITGLSMQIRARQHQGVA